MYYCSCKEKANYCHTNSKITKVNEEGQCVFCGYYAKWGTSYIVTESILKEKESDYAFSEHNVSDSIVFLD